MARSGSLSTGSTRFQTTAFAAALALSVMNTRPVMVAAQRVPVFWAVRCNQATAPPARLAPHAAEFNCVEGTPFPILTKSPQPGLVEEAVNSGQLASRNAWFPPQSCVRHTE